MTKVDERAVVPPVDHAARVRLAAALDVPGVVSALLYGSQATGKVGLLSDVDVAVWLDPEMTSPARYHLQLRLMVLASEALRTDEVQVVILDDATPLLRHRAIRDGVRLLDRDPRARIRLETRALLEYLDTAPLRAVLAAGLKRRIEEGRFGRR
ncbi:MAG: type VII toxin-antitoxin system MntA family adenylyltransferase antitoxin [Solirubrobacteraceae bacterium]